MHHTVAAEARRLFAKYRGTAFLKANCRSRREGDFHCLVAGRILELERLDPTFAAEMAEWRARWDAASGDAR